MLSPATPQSTSNYSHQNKQNPRPDQQLCPGCGYIIGSLAGSQDAVCKNCGFKDPCCE